jgi:ATP-dependent protease HslVU (ClpYQ) peptidase subunit
MSTVTVVKKNGQIAIAADTLTKWGGGKESAEYVVNHQKIIRVGESWLGITGSATAHLILGDYFAGLEETPTLASPAEIFRTWNGLHGAMKEHYFLQAEEDKEDELESSRMDVLIANRHGIFGVSAHRTVQEFSKFYAYGSGSPYALGAMFVAYRSPTLDAENVARLGVLAATEFHDESGPPVQSFVLNLEA